MYGIYYRRWVHIISTEEWKDNIDKSFHELWLTKYLAEYLAKLNFYLTTVGRSSAE